MSLGLRLTSMMGFDPEFQEGLDSRYRHGLVLVCSLAALPVGLIGSAAGYGLWLLERSLLLSTLGALGIGLFVLNLLRVSIAGSGMTLHLPRQRAAKWRPRTTPVLMFLLFGGVFAQPALLAFWGPPPGEDVAFPARCIQRLWQEPSIPVAFTATFCFAVLIPLLLVRGSRLAAVRAYEGRRYTRSRERIQAEHARTLAIIDGFLVAYPGYLGRAPVRFRDEPFCNDPVRPDDERA